MEWIERKKEGQVAKRGTFWISGSWSYPRCVSKAFALARQIITYRLVGDEVVDVVAALPPSDGQATAKVGDEHAEQRVHDEVLGDGTMAGIVRGEHDLVLECSVSRRVYVWVYDTSSVRRGRAATTYPEKAQGDGRGKVPAIAQGDNEEGK